MFIYARELIPAALYGHFRVRERVNTREPYPINFLVEFPGSNSKTEPTTPNLDLYIRFLGL